MNPTAELSDAKRLLLQKMLSGGAATAAAAVDSVTPRQKGEVPPLSLEQGHVWLHSSMAPDLPLYNEPITIHRRGPFDLAVMERSFNEILRRHEIWRTAFAVEGDRVAQIVHPDLTIRLPLVDLTGLPESEREAEALRIATEEARKPFDLGQAPLFRAQILKLADGDHRLYLTLHHIIFDGVTIYRVIVPELSAIYEAFAQGKPSPLPEPALQYGDYALWRERDAASPSMKRQMDYWRRELSGKLPVLQLPSDRPRPATLSYRGSMETFSLPRALTDTLQAFSLKEGATLYMTLLAGFKAMLHRYTGQEDILVGGVTDTRRRPELENVIGYFLNSIVLRTRPKADLPFRDFVRQTRDTVLGALGASDVPFDGLVRELHPRRDLGAHPLFQIFFSIEPPVPSFAEGWDLTQMDVTIGTAKFDIYLELDERPEGYIGRFMYSTDLFDAATIRRMIGHWQTLLEGAAADPDCTLARLPLLTAVERRQLLVGWNATQQPVPQANLHEAFKAQAQRTPSAVAVECEGSAWTYRQLDRRATLLAARLRQAGVEKGTLVGLCLERSLDMVAGLLAILKTGAAYLPLDPAFPKERLALIVEDAEPDLLLAQRSTSGLLPQSYAGIVLCDEESSEAPELQEEHWPAIGGDDLAYVLYTSGSTGKPKGVEIPHRAAMNLLASMQREPGFGADDILLAVTTLSFDIAALELFLPLISGGRVVIAPRDIATDPTLLAELIHQSRCTVMQATPATWRALIEEGWSGSRGLKILCGGEALPRDLADKLLARSASLWNMYGPTETTIWSAVHKVEAGAGPVPIGRPIANTTAYILDPHGQPAPVGVPGELLIGGAGVADGYRHRAKLTAERFVGGAVAPGERLYRTGDLARYRPDGVIECLGRTDNQVKIRGFRVEPEEIEAHLARHPQIAAAAVKAWPDSSGESSLAGYIVARSASAPNAADLRQFLRQTLPDYMVPSRFVTLPALPMTPNRKVDRNALPAAKAPAPQLVFAEPRGDAERRLAAIWKDVLGVGNVSAHDNFFDLGGHSLLLTRLLRRIELEFGRRLPMAAAFNMPTLQAMAALIAKVGSEKTVSRTVAIQPKGTRPALFWLNGGANFHPLAQALGPDQPFIDVPLDLPPGASLEHPPRLEDVAADMVSAIRATQPEGPYCVGGWCTAGILAFEVATQLTAQGETVGLLALAHTTNPVYYRKLTDFDVELSKFKLYVREFLRLHPRQMGRFALHRLLGIVRRVNEPWLPGEARQPEANKILDLSALGYVPKPYAGDAVLFQPEARPDIYDHWPAWVDVMRGKFAAIDIPGTHMSMLHQPNVPALAGHLNRMLRRVKPAGHSARKAAG